MSRFNVGRVDAKLGNGARTKAEKINNKTKLFLLLPGTTRLGPYVLSA